MILYPLPHGWQSPRPPGQVPKDMSLQTVILFITLCSLNMKALDIVLEYIYVGRCVELTEILKKSETK